MAQNNDVSENELEFFYNGVSVEDAMIAQRTRKCVAQRKQQSIDVDMEFDSEEEDSENIDDSDDDEDYVPEGSDDDDNWEGKKAYRACSHCDFVAASYPQLDKHVFEDHVDQRSCNQCEHHSETYNDFVKHNNTHSNTCNVCKQKLLGITALRNHKKTHLKRPALKEINTKKVSCNICSKLLNENALNAHLKDVHGSKDHKCDVCDFAANTKAKLEVHREGHYREMSICPECGKSFKSLKNHFRRNCSGKTKHHNCHLCEKTFKENNQLRKHIKCVHDKIKNIQCSLCEYKTYSKFNLKIHESKSHTKEDMTKTCSVCDQKTMSLDHHMRTYHFEAYLKNKNSVEPQ